jgi:hypothetical protein
MNPQAITHVVEHVRDVFIGKLFDDITCGFLTGVTRKAIKIMVGIKRPTIENWFWNQDLRCCTWTRNSKRVIYRTELGAWVVQLTLRIRVESGSKLDLHV